MRRYGNVRLRKGIGWVGAAGKDFVLPPDGDTFQVAPAAGAGGFLLYVVELPHAVAVLSRPSSAWISGEEAAARLLSGEFGVVVVLSANGPGAAIATCYSSRPDACEDAAGALWALKAKGGWDDSPIMTFLITHATEALGPSSERVPVRSTIWMTARSSDAFVADVSRARSGGWAAVRGELAMAPSSAATRVILIDVDWMMAFNDAYNHYEGDLLIARLWSSIAQRAGRDGANVVRVGGEEFAVIVNEATPGTALRLAETLRQDVEAMNIPFHHPELPTFGHLTVSAGVVAPADLSRLPDEASDAVYEAKKAGRNRVAPGVRAGMRAE